MSSYDVSPPSVFARFSKATAATVAAAVATLFFVVTGVDISDQAKAVAEGAAIVLAVVFAPKNAE